MAREYAGAAPGLSGGYVISRHGGESIPYAVYCVTAEISNGARAWLALAS